MKFFNILRAQYVSVKLDHFRTPFS